MTWTQTLRQRWWLAPIAILVVAAAIIIRIITTPLEVNANVNDGDQAVPRTATIDLRFNQDMKADSVQQAFSISPAVLVGFKTVSAREFQFRPKMAPNTSYRVTVKDAKNTSGRGVSSSFRFKTETLDMRFRGPIAESDNFERYNPIQTFLPSAINYALSPATDFIQ